MLANNAGLIQANDGLTLTLPTFNFNNGTFNAANSLIINTTGDIINGVGNQLITSGDLTLNTTGDITNQGEISSLFNINLSGRILTNSTAAIISAGDNLALSFSNIISNNGRLSAGQNLTLNAQNLDNYGTLAAGNNVQTIISNDLHNYNTLFAANDSQFYVGNTLYNHQNANIFTLNDLTIAADAGLAKNQAIINQSATIEALNGNITLATQTLENSTNLPTITNSNQIIDSNLIYRPQVGGAIYTGSVALPQAQGYLVLQATQPDALAIFESYGSNAAWSRFWNTDARKRVWWFDVNVNRSRQQADLSSINPAKLVAGNNLTINAGDISNQLSLIGADGNIDMTGNSLTNTALSLTETVSGLWRQGREKKRRAHPRVNPSQNNYYERSGSINASRSIGSVNSTIQAGGLLTGSFIGRIDNQNIKQNTAGLGHSNQTATTHANGQALQTIQPQGVATITGSTSPASLNNTVATLPPASLQTPTITLPTGTGLFVVNTQPSHPYLIETNPEFANYANFISSDYLLDRLGLNPEQANKRLGDGFYESRLLRDAIFAQTGRRYLQGQSNEQTQFKYLMDNAISARDSLNLSLGIALDGEQVARLTHDIVWLVEQNVQGQRVLVPRFYAATVNSNDINGQGALLVASTLALTGQGITNTGTIDSDNNLQLSSNSDLLNRGTLKSGGNIELVARNNLFNTGGNVFAKGDIILVASQGKIDIGRYTQQQSTTIDGPLQFTDTRTWVGEASTLQAGGNIDLHAGSDINIAGSSLKADKSINAHAGNKLNIQTVEATTAVHGQSAHGAFKVDFNATTLDQLASQIQAGEDINLTADEHLAIIGSTITSAGNTQLNAGGDITIAAAKQSSSYSDYNRSGGRKSTRNDKSTTHIQTTITADNISLNAANDIAITGSDLNANNDIQLQAQNNITLASVENSEYHYYYRKTKKSFGRKKSETLETDTLRNRDSTLNAGHDVLINVTKTKQDNSNKQQNLTLNNQAKDVNIIGSDINAGNDIAIYGGDKVSAQTSTDYDYRFHQKTKKGLFGQTGSSKSTTTKQIRQQQASFKSDNDINLNAGNNIALISPTLNATNNIDIKADNKVLIGSSKDSDYYHYEYNKTGAFKYEFGNKGHYDETIRHTEITAGGNINIDAGNGTRIEYQQNGTLQQSIDTLSQLPELAWMKDIQNQNQQNNKVNWIAIQAAHNKWQQHKSGIGGPGVTIIAIAVAIASAGAGA